MAADPTVVVPTTAADPTVVVPTTAIDTMAVPIMAVTATMVDAMFTSTTQEAGATGAGMGAVLGIQIGRCITILFWSS